MVGHEDGRAPEAAARKPARERILETAYGLFARRGVRDVGIDEIIAHSGVAKATFYRHFPSKEALVLAYMDRWYQVRENAIEEAIAHAHNPDDAILAAFTVLDDWFSRGAAEVNTFLHVVIEFGPGHLLGRAAMRHLTDIRERLCALAEAAGLEDPVGFAWSFHILTKGAMVASIEGDQRAAARARKLARALIDLHRPATPGRPAQTREDDKRQIDLRRREKANQN
ncbi:AcrR family transcriptional regulator [Sinomonas atrocyanea]|jgi:AcrR family transcriptional regulator|uniref:TetR/AcrR family transcriptional regulator n=1 Tax=Sinomonas atrocyanea TaxID=37927 RepID=UPI00278A45AB|nr:TetR/AcrR family transcriptional regulator [Sinomonas atrocyanea]MDP9884861.1 AcrR family transcriptional regulator [Sinomonas atrocyanea]